MPNTHTLPIQTHRENHEDFRLPFDNYSEIEANLESLKSLMDHNILDLCGRYESRRRF